MEKSIVWKFTVFADPLLIYLVAHGASSYGRAENAAGKMIKCAGNNYRRSDSLKV
uniref:RxLR effector candidate protein n=1 Tax=Hyaloperonospora arabidopsidis (strain Emoy2) TaxID=559515 RepID=M4B5U5_HYAAE